MNLTLARDTSRTDCTLGVLTVAASSFQTMERPWVPSDQCRGGTSQVSCVPPGTYELVTHDTPKHPHTWALVNADLDVCANPAVGKRSDVLLHSANWSFQLEGCIAPGKSRTWDGREWMVTDSRQAMDEIRLILPWIDGHTLTITEAP